jgi:EAL domain-containing protein (putative c-di-GMP-specific phosphodiesterase class I)
MLEAIVTLAHKLGIMVVAEGIEDADQLRAVRNAGCDEVQGFLFARPGLPGRIHHVSMSADLAAFAKHLESQRVLV